MAGRRRSWKGVGTAPGHAPRRRRAWLKRLLVLALALGAAWAGVGAAQRLPRAERRDWYFIDRQDGVLVLAHDHPGRELPTLRGIGDVKADFFTIASVLADAGRQAEWLPNCMHAERLANDGDFDQTFYHQMWAPWPVTNRDLVFRVQIHYRPRYGEMLARFFAVNHAARPERADFVRMKKLDGYYHLRALGPQLTRVTMQVDIDPGGLVPEWLVKSVTRTYPLNTLRGLREQIRRTQGVYATELERLRARYGAYSMAAAATDASDQPRAPR